MKINVDYSRNKKIYEEYLNSEKVSMEQIGLKYDISRQQVYNIIARFNELKQYAGFYTLCEITNYNTNMMSRLYSSLGEWFGTNTFTVYDITQIDTYEFSKLPSVGILVSELLVKFKQELGKEIVKEIKKAMD